MAELQLIFSLVCVGGVDKYTNLASQVTLFLADSKAIVYVDFVQDVSSLAISLHQNGLSSCSYHGDKMTAHDKMMALERGEVQVMVCTSAFGMGINQPDVDKVIRIGVPPSLEQCVQEFGRAGRDGRQCEGIIFFHESDLQHAKFWCEGEDADRQLQILTDFQASWCTCTSYDNYLQLCLTLVYMREVRSCSQYPSEKLTRSNEPTGECPVEFVYIHVWPVDEADNRRWITGITRGGLTVSENLHNHPIHSSSKIPSKVDTDIRSAVIADPNLKTKDLLVGEYCACTQPST